MRRRREPSWLHLALAIYSLGVWVSGAMAASCRDQLQTAVVGKASESRLEWIDADTPDDECIKKLCREGYDRCQPGTAESPETDMAIYGSASGLLVAMEPPTSKPQSELLNPRLQARCLQGTTQAQAPPALWGQGYLVFSDEFKQEGRKLKAAAKDTKWTAMDLYYFPTQDEEVYKPEQVRTEDGNLVITVDKRTASAYTQQPDGELSLFTKDYVSGMVQGFNKFCYTGGYLEALVQLPGDDKEPGLWPGFWTMGNLGRAGYMQSTGGMWPYSYNQCDDGAAGQPWSKNSAQTLSACGDQAGINRTHNFGMAPGVGRGSPEFDVFEVSVPSDGEPAHASQTLQMAPLLPFGTSWTDKVSEDGIFYPGEKVQPFDTRPNPWQGEFSRPGNSFQDSISALSDLNSTHFTGFHKYGVDWKPGEYLRWYIDDEFLYEVNQKALIGRKNGTGAEVGERIIPLEPVYVILNVAMSNAFNSEKLDYSNLNLQFPQEMKVGWVRVYQDPQEYNVGCSPKEFPTAQYIACNREKYTAVDCDGVMITEKCESKDVPIEECSEYNKEGGELATIIGTLSLAFMAIALLG